MTKSKPSTIKKYFNKDNKELNMYSYDSLLSEPALIAATVSGKGIGKTFAFKARMLKRALKKGEQFIYLRRFGTDIERSMDPKKNNFFDEQFENKVVEKFELSMSSKNRIVSVFNRKDLIGYGIPLSLGQSIQSINFEKVSTIFFDEFIIHRGAPTKYLDDEYKVFMNLINTVRRYRKNVRVIMASNSVSIFNPYFDAWNITNFEKTQRIKQNGKTLVKIEFPKGNFTASDENDELNMLAKLTDKKQYEMSVHGNFEDAETSFKTKLDSNSKNVYNIVIDGFKMGVWLKQMKNTEVAVFSEKNNPELSTINLNNSFNDDESQLSNSELAIKKVLINQARQNNIYFDSNRIRGIIINYMRGQL